LTKAVLPAASARPARISIGEAAIIAKCPPATITQAISTHVLACRKDRTIALEDALRFCDDLWFSIRSAKRMGVAK
jgi:hypothetical protein